MIVPFRKILFPVCCILLTGILSASERGIPVLEAGKRLGADVVWDPLTGSIGFTSSVYSVECRIGEPLAFFNSEEAALVEPPMLQNGVPVLPESLFAHIESFFKRSRTDAFFRVGAILIDPGHGGKDPGTIGSYQDDGTTVSVYEKNIVLTVALDLYKKLKHRYPDKKILLTRSDDTYLSLEERVELANTVSLKKHEAVLYLSIHANSAGFNKRPIGFEVWYLPSTYRRELVERGTASNELLPILNSMLEEEFTTESILIAKDIVEGLDGQIGTETKNRGIKQEEWFVVKNAKMPSVLIELGFVSNPEEVRRLNTPQYLQRCSLGIYNGLVTFITRFETM